MKYKWCKFGFLGVLVRHQFFGCFESTDCSKHVHLSFIKHTVKSGNNNKESFIGYFRLILKVKT